jgi:hypothetical protein
MKSTSQFEGSSNKYPFNEHYYQRDGKKFFFFYCMSGGKEPISNQSQYEGYAKFKRLIKNVLGLPESH